MFARERFVVRLSYYSDMEKYFGRAPRSQRVVQLDARSYNHAAKLAIAPYTWGRGYGWRVESVQRAWRDL